MATDGPDPKPCDPEIYKNGVVVGMFETFGANRFEALIQTVRDACGKPVDWHYAGGRAVVKCHAQDFFAVEPLMESLVKPALEEHLKLKRIALFRHKGN